MTCTYTWNNGGMNHSAWLSQPLSNPNCRVAKPAGFVCSDLSCPGLPANGMARGDVNCDGSLTMNDAALIQRYLALKVVPTCKGAPVDPAILDVNGDGKVDQADIDAIKKSVLGNCK